MQKILIPFNSGERKTVAVTIDNNGKKSELCDVERYHDKALGRFSYSISNFRGMNSENGVVKELAGLLKIDDVRWGIGRVLEGIPAIDQLTRLYVSPSKSHKIEVVEKSDGRYDVKSFTPEGLDISSTNLKSLEEVDNAVKEIATVSQDLEGINFNEITRKSHDNDQSYAM